jgi:hypothetical protein
MQPSSATRLNVAIKNLFTCSSLGDGSTYEYCPGFTRPQQNSLDRRPATGDQLNQQYNDCNNEKNVDVTAQGVSTDQSQQPQNQQDHKNRPQHKITSSVDSQRLERLHSDTNQRVGVAWPAVSTNEDLVDWVVDTGITVENT